MNRSTLWLLLLAGVAMLAISANAQDTFQAMAIQRATLYGEPLRTSEETREQYVSQGQDYLRDYMRQRMLDTIAAEWLETDMQTMQAGMAVDLTTLTGDPDSPWHAKMKVFAEEDIARYLDCGRFLPIEVQMESTYQFENRMSLRARLEAPFDDLLRLRLGSEWEWSYGVQGSLEYLVSNGSRVYDGMVVGLGVQLADWMVKWKYNLTPELDQLYQLGLAKHF